VPRGIRYHYHYQISPPAFHFPRSTFHFPLSLFIFRIRFRFCRLFHSTDTTHLSKIAITISRRKRPNPTSPAQTTTTTSSPSPHRAWRCSNSRRFLTDGLSGTDRLVVMAMGGMGSGAS
jgi:hypothetical protein